MRAVNSSRQDTLEALSRRLIWWKAPADALADRTRFLAQVMTFGTWDDISEAKTFWSETAFREALREAPAGVFDVRSWTYWHHVLGLLPVPPLPTRKLPQA